MTQDTSPGAAEMAAYRWVTENPPGLDPVCGDAGYPTEIEDQRIRHWFDETKVSYDSFVGLMAYTRERWKYPDYWTELVDRDGNVFYQISTGGWSGNEQLWAALESTIAYWIMFVSHRRGGHYVLELKSSLKERNGN